MNIEMRKVESLAQDPANVRVHDERNLEAIQASLQRFGQQKPIVVDSSGVVRAGNGTLAAAKALGWDEVAVVITDLKGVDATAYAIADNRTSELAMWDDQALAAVLQSLDADDSLARLAAGFDDEEMAELCKAFDIDGSAMPELASGDKSPFQQMTFTLHDSQAEVVKEAMEKAKAAGGEVSGVNENSNGNALAWIAEVALGRR